MKLAFVLVEPKVPENVGAAARALCTMGFGDLWIVNSDLHQTPEAHWLAHGSDHVLDQTRIFPDLVSVRNQADLVIGTSAKPRHHRIDWHGPAELSKVLGARRDEPSTVALVFGREDRGLSNEELASCDLLTGLPMRVSYPSLNLAQAVMVYAWELSGVKEPSVKPPQSSAKDQQSLATLRSRLEQLLPELNTPPNGKLWQWVFQRLALLGPRDTRMAHTLVGNVENAVKRRMIDSADKHVHGTHE